MGGTVVNRTLAESEPCACSPLGKLKRASNPHAPGAANVVWTEYAYDGLGRTTKVDLVRKGTNPTTFSTTNYEYGANWVKVTDPGGRWKKYTRNQLGQIAYVEEPNPNGTAGEKPASACGVAWASTNQKRPI